MKRTWIKRIVIAFLILILLGITAFTSFFTGLASGLFASGSDQTLSEEVILGDEFEDKIGIIRFEGIILTSGADSPFSTSGIITASQVKRWLREINQDNDLKALIIEVNSPGGSPVASDEIYKAIQTLRRSGKSVVIVMEDTATSGAYYFSAAADKIVASPATLTGSIGVITEIANFEELFNKLGISIEVYTSGKFKDITSPVRERSEEEKELIRDYVNSAYDLFVKRVVEGRGMEEARIKELAQGQIFSGERALELGLIDQLGSVDEALSTAKNLQNLQNVRIVRYRTESPIDLLLGRVGTLLNPLSAITSRLLSPGLRAAYLPSY